MLDQDWTTQDDELIDTLLMKFNPAEYVPDNAREAAGRMSASQRAQLFDDLRDYTRSLFVMAVLAEKIATPLRAAGLVLGAGELLMGSSIYELLIGRVFVRDTHGWGSWLEDSLCNDLYRAADSAVDAYFASKSESEVAA